MQTQEEMQTRNKPPVRQRLLAKLDELDRRSNPEGLVLERCNDPMDRVQARFEMDLAISAINKDWQTRQSVEAALELLELDEYGICQECGAVINPNRLEAIPWTTLCIYCQDESDSSPRPAVRRYRRAA